MLLGWRCWGSNEQVDSTSKARDVMQVGCRFSMLGFRLHSSLGISQVRVWSCDNHLPGWLTSKIVLAICGVLFWDAEILGVFLLLWREV